MEESPATLPSACADGTVEDALPPAGPHPGLHLAPET